MNALTSQLHEALSAMPLLDAHTHLVNGRLGARGLHDILLYHMVMADLYAAGCPSGHRLTEYPGWPSDNEAHARLREAMPYVQHIANTSCFWGVRTILAELYGWTEPLTEHNWHRIDAIIRERADDRAWHREIIRRTGVRKFTTEIARREAGVDDDLFHYSLEWAFFTRAQRGEHDTALHELERCWGRKPESPRPHADGKRPVSDRMIHTLADVHAALEHYVSELAASPVISMATHIASDIAMREVSDAEMEAALKKRATAGTVERDIYASYIHEAFLRALVPHAQRMVFHFSFAAEPLPHHTASLVPQRAIADLAEMITRHPKIRFNIFVASRHANQSICTLCRGLPNLSVSGYWWHNFFPGSIRSVMEERLDMLPANRQVGFFSDAYCIEWTYAKAAIVRREMASVLAAKIDSGQYSMEQALAIAKATLYDAPQSLLGMKP